MIIRQQSGSASEGSFAAGTQPFLGRIPLATSPSEHSVGSGSQSRPPLNFVGMSASEDGDAFKLKQLEIRQLQDATGSLLRRAGTSASASVASARPDDVGSLQGSASGLLSGRSGRSSVIAPLTLLSSRAPVQEEQRTSLPVDDDGASSLWSGSALTRQTSPQAAVPRTAAASERTMALVPDASRSQNGAADQRSLREENASLRQEVMELRRGNNERDKEIRLQNSAVRRSGELNMTLKQRLAEAERTNGTLSDEIEGLQKAGDIGELIKGDRQLHGAVRSYIENDLATMRADRRLAEEALRAELQACQEQVHHLQIQLHNDDTQGNKQLGMERRINSLETLARETEEARAVLARDAAGLQAKLDILEAERQKFGRGDHEETKKVKRRLAELENQSAKDADESAAKVKEIERGMHQKLSDARQERTKVETKLKKQLQTTQAEHREVQAEHSGALVEVAKGSAATLEYVEAHTRANESQEECVVLHKRCAAERSKGDSFQRKAKWEEVECRQHLQIELVKEHARAHDEAWAQLSVIEERHGTKHQELQEKHHNETTKLSNELREGKRAAEKRADEEELKVSKRVQAIHTQLEGEKQKLLSKDEQIAFLQKNVEELKQEVAGTREECDSAVQQHEALLAVLRREREVADEQFQHLVAHTEEKQRAIHHLQREADYDQYAKSGTPKRDWGCPTSSLPPLVSSGGALSVVRCTADGDSDDSARTPINLSPRQDEDEDNGVAAMLSHLSVEREVHETRRIAEELSRMLSAAGAGDGAGGSVNNLNTSNASITSWAGSAIGAPFEWRSQAKKMLEQLLASYEHAMKHVSDEKQRMEAAKKREQSIRDHIHRVEGRHEKKHETIVFELKKNSHVRLQNIETEAIQMEEALQAAFQAERGELQEHVNKVNEDKMSLTKEHEVLKIKYDALDAADAKTLQCRVDAVSLKCTADMATEFAEVKMKAEVDMIETKNKHQNAFEKLQAATDKQCKTLECKHADEHEEIRLELQELSSCLHKELAVARDEHSAFVKHEAKLEARIDSFKQDRSETEIEVSETKANLQRELDLRMSEVKGLESSLQATERKMKATEGEWSADRFEHESVLERLDMSHAEEREVLAREIAQFQDERLVLDERFRQQEVFSETRFETFREEMEDVEMDLQRTEAVSAERGRLIEQFRLKGTIPRSPPRKASPPGARAVVDDGQNNKMRASSPKSQFSQRRDDHDVERLHAANEKLQLQVRAKMKVAADAEAEANAVTEVWEEKCEMQLEAWAQSEKESKGQLCQLREDKNRERQMKDRTIDKLKGRVSELATASETFEKKHASEAAEHRRHTNEMVEKLTKARTEGQKIRGFLQESKSDNAAAHEGIEALQTELSRSQAMLASSHQHCESMLQESHTGRHMVNNCQAEVAGLQAARDNELRTVATLEMQMEHARRSTMSIASEHQEAQSVTDRLCKTFGDEILNVLPMMPEHGDLSAQLSVAKNGGVPSENAVLEGFKALANFVSDLARKNAELRNTESHTRPNPNAIRRAPSKHSLGEDEGRQMATLQKDAMKMKEESQELRLENNQLQKQLDSAVKARDHHKEEVSKLRSEANRNNEVANRQRGEDANNQQVDAPNRQQLNEARRQRDDAIRQRDEALLQRDESGAHGGEIAQSQLNASRGDESFGSDISPSRGGPTPTSPVLDSRTADIDEFALQARRKTPSFGGLNNVEMRLKLREIHAEKVQSETFLASYKQELKVKTSALKEQIDELKAQLWESQHEREDEADQAQKSLAKQDRKVKYLEGKIHERMESERLLTLEKEGVEEQLNFAAKQLEALLAEEGKDGDLQRDLAGLSQQFENLNGKHRQQLAKAQEMNKAMEREREKRVNAEEQLHSHEMNVDRELRLAHERHMAQMNQIQDQVQVARTSLQTKERELQESLAERSTLTCEISNLRSLQQQQTLSIQEMQEEIKRLGDELNSQSQLLREARDKGPGAKEAMSKLRQKEDEREAMEQALQASEGNQKRAQTDARARAIEVEDLRRANESLTQEARRREEELRCQSEVLERHSRLRVGDGSSVVRSSSSSPPRERRDARDQRETRDGRPSSPDSDSGAMARPSSPGWDSGYPESSRTSRRPGDLVYERNRDSEDAVCEIRTVADSQSDSTAPSRNLSAQRSPSPEEIRNRLQGQAGLLSALEEIQDTLSSRERELLERKAGLSDSRSSSSVTRSFPSESLGPHAGLIDDFGEAVDLPPVNGRPPSPPRTAPSATADVQLKDSEGRAAVVRGYPESPPGGGSRGTEIYSHSSSRDDQTAGRDAQVPAQITAADGAGGSTSSSAKSHQAGQQGLPSVVRDTFRRAEALCERHKFDEAVPCFQQVLQILEGGSPEVEGVLPVVVAEVWAHLGVAMQSLDRVQEAIDSYKRAVTLDGSLHVCFANLATLHAYLNEHDYAAEYIAKALELDPYNATYNQIRRHMDDAPPQKDKVSADGQA